MKAKLSYQQVSERLREGYRIQTACDRASGLLQDARKKTTFTSIRKLIAKSEEHIANAKKIMDECEERQGGLTD